MTFEETPDLSRIPEPLRRDIEETLTFARAVFGAVDELAERARSVMYDYCISRHPSLADPDDADDIDHDLQVASGVDDVHTFMCAIEARAGAVTEGDPIGPEVFHKLGLHGPGLDDFVPELIRVEERLEHLEASGVILRMPYHD